MTDIHEAPHAREMIYSDHHRSQGYRDGYSEAMSQCQKKIKQAYEEGRKDGIREGRKEVAEWLMGEWHIEKDEDYQDLPYYDLSIEVWQAKLREWGIEEER